MSLRGTIAARLARVREQLSRLGVAALYVPSSDPHGSEYLPGRWQTRAWLSGFGGSAGNLAVTGTRCALFVDSRYVEIAQREIGDCDVEIVLNERQERRHESWLAETLLPGDVVLVDGASMIASAAEALRQALAGRGILLRHDVDVFEQAWPDRPAMPSGPLYRHRAPHATRSRAQNLRHVREAMAAAGVTHHLLSSLDDIAWLTCLRGSDIDFNPFFLSHLLIGPAQAELFVGRGKVDDEIAGELAADGIVLRDYDGIVPVLAALPAGSRLLLDPAHVSLALRAAVPPTAGVLEGVNPSTLAKARKTPEEIAGFRRTMIEDGAAFCRFYAAFEASLQSGREWGEYEVHLGIDRERARSPLYVSPSFSTTAAFNANGAMPHYSPTPQKQGRIGGDGLLLVDTGGQYLTGTTDVTRMWPVGRISEAMRRDVTAVLKGLIALSRARFPAGIPAPHLDAIARAPIWARSLDYRHGTGHGVGYFLGVHEGPQYLGGPVSVHSALEEGIVLTIEPGIYRSGEWGVRIENVLVTVAAPEAGCGKFLGFETLTLCPIDPRCLHVDSLDADEIGWLDAYHDMVRERLEPHVSGAARDWLLARTRPVSRIDPG